MEHSDRPERKISMVPILMNDRAVLLNGDSSALDLGEHSIDAIVTDPPAGIGFMGKGWDSDKGGREKWIAWLAETLAPAFRALKPGGHALVWAIPRTSHWTATALELAGFEIRDVVMHLFGTGFPKSLDVSKAVDKLDAADERRRRALRFTEWVRSTGLTSTKINEITGTNMGGHYTTAATQPAVATREHLEMLRPHVGDVPAWVEELVGDRVVKSKNFESREVVGHSNGGFAGGTGEHNGESDAYGFGAEYDVTAPATTEAKRWSGWGTALKPAAEHWILCRKPLEGTIAKNVLTHGTGALNVDGCRIATDDVLSIGSGSLGYHGADGSNAGAQNPLGRWPAHVTLDEEAAAALDAQSGTLKSGSRAAGVRKGLGYHGADGDGGPAIEANSGGASRFFYVAKPSRKERDAGLEEAGIEPKGGGEATGRKEGSAGTQNPRAGAGRTGGARNSHPTVKSISLMRWLVRLITPPGGVVLDPFAGSGSTGVAALAEGASFIGVEQSEEYCQIAKARLVHALKGEGSEG